MHADKEKTPLLHGGSHMSSRERDRECCFLCIVSVVLMCFLPFLALFFHSVQSFLACNVPGRVDFVESLETACYFVPLVWRTIDLLTPDSVCWDRSPPPPPASTPLIFSPLQSMTAWMSEQNTTTTTACMNAQRHTRIKTSSPYEKTVDYERGR